jgi:signal transduction histidine kinase
MLDRARSLGGRIDVTSGSTGTTVLLIIPLDGSSGQRETE